MQALVRLVVLSSILVLSEVALGQQQGRVVIPPNIGSVPLVQSSKQTRGPSRLSSDLRQIRAAYKSRGQRWQEDVPTAGLVMRGSSAFKIELRFDPESWSTQCCGTWVPMASSRLHPD
jgi:hypothetical protein